MKNYVKDGKNMTFTAPSGGVVSGAPVLIGVLLVVPLTTALEGEQFAGEVNGVIQGTKVSAQAWTEGQLIFWDNTNKRFTTASATGLYACGVAGAAAANPSATGTVRLDGIALTAVA